MGVIITIAVIIFNIFTVYKFLFKKIFINGDDFNESVRYSLIPDIISLFRGEYCKDRVAEFKLGMFIILCIIVTIIEYEIINGILQWVI